MFIAAVNGGPRNANYLIMEDWVKVYDCYLGTALTDSFGSEVFFNNFSKKHACLFDGVRQDSGDPNVRSVSAQTSHATRTTLRARS